MVNAFSTGPLENEVVFGAESHTVSQTAWTKVLNNHPCQKVYATILVFALDGRKVLLHHTILAVAPRASGFDVADVSGANEFEVQVAIWPRRDADAVLLSVFGKDETGALVAAHRLVHQELTPIHELAFADDDPRVQPSAKRSSDAGDA